MSKFLLFMLGVAIAAIAGCAPATKSTSHEQISLLDRGSAHSESMWHDKIQPAPTTQPIGSRDPVTFEEIRNFAELDFPRPLSREVAFKILLNTETFAEGRLQSGKSVQVEAFQVVLAQPDAVPTFTDLLKRAHPAGQLYALCGLRLWAQEKYAAVEPEFANSKVIVQVESGDVGSSRTVGELVKSSDPNTVRLLPGETVEKWELRVNTPDGGHYDISGGGYPDEFRIE